MERITTRRGSTRYLASRKDPPQIWKTSHRLSVEVVEAVAEVVIAEEGVAAAVTEEVEGVAEVATWEVVVGAEDNNFRVVLAEAA